MARRTTLPLACALALLAAPRPASPRGFDADPGWAARGAAAADLDGDGALDLVLAEAFLDVSVRRGRVVVLLGDPGSPGRWRSRSVEPVGADPRAVLVADLDGNGRRDVVTAGGSAGTVTVLLQDLAGAFARSDAPATAAPRAMAAGDLDRDGLPDLALAGLGEAVVLLQDGSAPGTFLPPAVLAAGVSPSCVAVADMDGAAGNDVVLGLFDRVEILLQDGAVAGSFPSVAPVAAPGGNLRGIAAADLDGDGRTDLACAMQGLGLLLQDGAGGLVFQSSLVGPGLPYGRVDVQDMDADGTPDLLATGGSRVSWFRQDPAARGTFRRGGHGGARAAEGAFAAGDFDGDGLVDAAVAFFRPFLLLQNPARPRHFRAPRLFRETDS